MPQNDPYAPPQASLAGITPSEQYQRESGELRYSAFWQRVGATLIDFLILSPLIALDFFMEGRSRMYHLYALAPAELLSAFLYLFMVVKYGGTPGKLLMGLRIARLDGAVVTWKEAALRYAPLWLLNIALSLVTIGAALGMTDEAYKSLEYLERSDAMDAQAPMIQVLAWLMMAWMFASLVAMLANDKRRTLHDFIAGTVVVRK